MLSTSKCAVTINVIIDRFNGFVRPVLYLFIKIACQGIVQFDKLWTNRIETTQDNSLSAHGIELFN